MDAPFFAMLPSHAVFPGETITDATAVPSNAKEWQKQRDNESELTRLCVGLEDRCAVTDERYCFTLVSSG
jgi:hypothetical protein